MASVSSERIAGDKATDVWQIFVVLGLLHHQRTVSEHHNPGVANDSR